MPLNTNHNHCLFWGSRRSAEKPNVSETESGQSKQPCMLGFVWQVFESRSLSNIKETHQRSDKHCISVVCTQTGTQMLEIFGINARAVKRSKVEKQSP